MKEPTPEKIFPSPGEAFSILIVTFLLPAFFVVLTRLMGLQPENKLNLLIAEAFTILPAYLFLFYRKYPVSLVFRLQPVSLRIIGVSAVIGLALSFISDEIERLMHIILPLPREIETTFSTSLKAMLTANTPLDWILLILSTVLIAGLFEEMLFRGLLQNSLEEKMDITRAVLATAIVFSFIHFNPYWVVPIAILGVFLGVLAWKSNSIVPSATVHAVNNGLALVMTNLPEQKIGFLEWHGHVNPIFLLLAVIALYFGIKFFYQFVEEDMEIPTLLNQPL
ncbi:MAG: CPBP family intramembrane metalloprotease [Calditrichaeota bacterium]|nr:MAG: CPBP family intramembrane metalloprotease [Calditrichota bacterium]